MRMLAPPQRKESNLMLYKQTLSFRTEQEAEAAYEELEGQFLDMLIEASYGYWDLSFFTDMRLTLDEKVELRKLCTPTHTTVFNEEVDDEEDAGE
jgi:hypothetical protein